MTVVELINSELESTRLKLIEQYDRLGLRASGSYERSLETYLVENDPNIRAGILGAEHSYFMEEGRGPNKRQDRGMIAFIYVKLLEWMKVKGITDINPWMAARKIVREGIKVPNKNNAGGVISGVITEAWFDDLQAKILDVQNDNIVDAVLSDLKTVAV
jgi:hypothetical protein